MSKKLAEVLENILSHEIDPAFALRAKFILNIVQTYKPKTVLDAGCGRGFYLNCLTNFDFLKSIEGFDLNDKYLEVAKKQITDERVRIQKAEITGLPYPRSCFDLIICTEVLEHLDDDRSALKELRRVLKPNGFLIVTVPNKDFPFMWDPVNWTMMKFANRHIDKNIWWLAGIWADHERLYTIKEIKSQVTSSGFSVKKQDFFLRFCLPFSHFLLYGIGKNLVERFGFLSFSRFNQTRQRPLVKAFASIFALPSKIFPGKMSVPPSSSMGIGLLLQKS